MAEPATAFLLSHSLLVIEPLVLGVFESLFPSVILLHSTLPQGLRGFCFSEVKADIAG